MRKKPRIVVATESDRATAVVDDGLAAAARRLIQYRTLAYLATFFSGAVSLTFQVVWQRYLSFMVGSEARSISLVVAVFLLGLAAGYRYWGNFTTRGWSRRTMLKAVGYIELAIAAYGLVFPSLFLTVRDIAYAAPDLLVVDFAATAALVLLPTFLMGASIPLLTTAIPATMAEVNHCHTRIYGINTLGAFAGTFIAGFLLVPSLGLSLSLIVGAVANMVVGLVFVFNTLAGDVHQGEESASIPNRFGASGIYLFVFVTGAVTIGFEILFMRLLSLSIGSGHYVFPIVVGIVILGLAIGSLSIRRGSVTANRVVYELVKLGTLLVIVFLTVPYWPLWISHIRVSLTSIPSNFGVFHALVVAFMMLILLPVVVPMGRLLPMGYSLIDKSSADYGRVCGRVYFSNTLGTVVGAVGMGYMLLVVLDVQQIFLLNIALIFLLASFLAYRQNSIAWAVACIAPAVILVPMLTLWMPWDRQLHVHGLFRFYTVQPYHFTGLLTMPDRVVMDEDSPQDRESAVLFLEDDPSVTVAVFRAEASAERGQSQTLYVNGKSDGNTIGDYSNMALSAALPYLYAPSASELDAAVIGLGMGITSGTLAMLPDVRQVTTLEISSGVVKAARYFEDANHQLLANPKHRIVQTDAFRFFTRSPQTFDLIVSEPSNPWVVGVENLYTPEFYRMASSRMNQGGIYFQWLQIYEIDTEVFAAIVANVARHFQHVSVYLLGPYDVGILASNEPLTRPHLEARMQQREMQQVMFPMALGDADLLVLLELFRTQQVRSLALKNAQLVYDPDSGSSTVQFKIHHMERPWLGHAAGRARFLGQAVDPADPAMFAGTSRHLLKDPARYEAFQRSMAEHGDDLSPWCAPQPGRHSTGFICRHFETLVRHHHQLQQPITAEQAGAVIGSYHQLRAFAYIPPNLAILEGVRGALRESQLPPQERSSLIERLAIQYVVEERWQDAVDLVAEFRSSLHPEDYQLFISSIERMRVDFQLRMAAVAEWNSIAPQ